MKESTLLEIKNKVETLGSIVQMMHQELANIKDLAVGTMELVKKFEGYDKAIEDLKADIVEREKEDTDEGSK